MSRAQETVLGRKCRRRLPPKSMLETPDILLEMLDLTREPWGRQALRNLDISVDVGAIGGLIGPHGAAKSMALDVHMWVQANEHRRDQLSGRPSVVSGLGGGKSLP